MDEPTNLVDPSTINKLTPLEQVKLQAQAVVPLLRAFRKELGTERANAIAYRALQCDESDAAFGDRVRQIAPQKTGKKGQGVT